MALFDKKELEILNQYKEELNTVETKADLAKLYIKMDKDGVSGIFLIEMILALALKMDEEEIVSVYGIGPVSDGILFELRFVPGEGLNPRGSLFLIRFICTANTILANLPFSEKDLDAIYKGQASPLYRNQQARQFERDKSFYEALRAKDFSEDQTRGIIETAYDYGIIEKVQWYSSSAYTSEERYFNTDPSILDIVKQVIHLSKIYAYDMTNHIKRLY